MKKIIFAIIFILFFSACQKKSKDDLLTDVIQNFEYESIADENFVKLDNTPISWGLKKNKNAPPDVLKKDAELLEQFDAFYMDKREGKNLYLTFDEGYENGYTEKILDVLAEKKIPAAFFVTGDYVEKEPKLIQRMLDEGHIVGNHTKNHPNLPRLQSVEAMTEELEGLKEKFLADFGVELKYMRPPEGVYSKRLLALSKTLGYKTIFWSFAYKDWDTNSQKGAEYAFSQTTPYLHDGAILLLHAVSKDNADALTNIIDYAISQGYTFLSLDELE